MNLRDIKHLSQIKMIEGVVEVDVEMLSIHIIDDVWIKTFLAKKSGTFIGQHAHKWPHGTLVGAGEFRLFIDEEMEGDYKPGDVIEVKAGRMHVLLALEDNSLASCIHNIHGLLEPEVQEETKFK